MISTSANNKYLKPDSRKDSRLVQEYKVFQSFLSSPKTMKEVDTDTGVMRENICRYVKALRLNGKIAWLRQRFCKTTNHLAGEYTTNTDLFPKISLQLNLFPLNDPTSTNQGREAIAHGK